MFFITVLELFLERKLETTVLVTYRPTDFSSIVFAFDQNRNKSNFCILALCQEPQILSLNYDGLCVYLETKNTLNTHFKNNRSNDF